MYCAYVVQNCLAWSKGAKLCILHDTEPFIINARNLNHRGTLQI